MHPPAPWACPSGDQNRRQLSCTFEQDHDESQLQVFYGRCPCVHDGGTGRRHGHCAVHHNMDRHWGLPGRIFPGRRQERNVEPDGLSGHSPEFGPRAFRRLLDRRQELDGSQRASLSVLHVAHRSPRPPASILPIRSRTNWLPNGRTAR